MSAYPNSGTIGRNERMRPDKNDPEYSGQCEVDGKEYWISAWIKEGKKGKFWSLSFKPKETRNAMDQRTESRPNVPPTSKPTDNDIPF